MKKTLLASLVSVAFLTSVVSFAPVAYASVLTSSQINNIISLLRSYGADPSTIANVKTAITPVPTTLSAAKSTGYSDQTVPAGVTNTRIGSFTLTAGRTEGVTVRTIELTMSSTSALALMNISLKDGVTGAGMGFVGVPSPKNTIPVVLNIPTSGSKTIDIYASILPSATGSIQTTLTSNTAGIGNITGQRAAVEAITLQTITIGSSALSLSVGQNYQTSGNIIAGASSVPVGEFTFMAKNSAHTVRSLAILIPSSAANSISAVTISYKDVNGTTQTATQGLSFSANPSTTDAAAFFTGLSLYVPANQTANLDVSVGTVSIVSGATSGAAISVGLDTTPATFSAVTSTGMKVGLTQSNSAGKIVSGGTFYIRKSVPTFAMVPMGISVPVTGLPLYAGQPLYEFTVSADPAGAIEWSKVSFNLPASNVNPSNFYLVDDATGNTLTDSPVNSVGGIVAVDLTKNVSQPKYVQVAAGTTKTYKLMATVNGFTTGPSLTISLAPDNQVIANNTATVVAAGNNVVWSDRSAVLHTQNSKDYSNGAFLNGFANSTMIYAKGVVPTEALGSYIGYMNDRIFITTQNISQADALANCKTNAALNPTAAIRCTWNGTEILAPSGGAVAALGTYVGYFNGNVFITDQSISQADALANCKTNAAANPTAAIRCTWNGTEILAPSGGVISTTTALSSGQSSQLASAYSALAPTQTVSTPSATPSMAENPTKFTHTFSTDLYHGSQGAEVSDLQEALSAEGLLDTGVSGNFYDHTYDAVKAFQQKYGITATGYVGGVTRAKLNSLYGK